MGKKKGKKQKGVSAREEAQARKVITGIIIAIVIIAVLMITLITMMG